MTTETLSDAQLDMDRGSDTNLDAASDVRVRRSRRTDCHRAGALIPEDYDYVFSYARPTTQDGWPVPGFNINCELDRQYKDGVLVFQRKHAEDGHCCIIGLLHIAKVRMARYGGTCKCTACGTRFAEGDVWRHRATGEYVHIGHTCSEKYNLIADRTEFHTHMAMLRQKSAAERLRDMARLQREAFMDAHPGLRENLLVDHPILRDIGAQFAAKCELSEKQVALVAKIAERHVPAPEGRVTVIGTIVSIKTYDEGLVKMVVKVQTRDGSWLVFSTVPSNLLKSENEWRPLNPTSLKGREVEFVATLKRGRDAHFALASRPTNARFVTKE